jgi:hypothetical protein
VTKLGLQSGRALVIAQSARRIFEIQRAIPPQIPSAVLARAKVIRLGAQAAIAPSMKA